MPNNVQILADAEKKNVRIDKLVWLAAVMAGSEDRMPDALEDLFDHSADHKVWAQILECVPAFRRACEQAASEEEAWMRFFDIVVQRKQLGFLARVSTPVRSAFDSHGGHTSSWAYCWCSWVYGETVEEVWAAALKWASEREQLDRAKENAARG